MKLKFIFLFLVFVANGCPLHAGECRSQKALSIAQQLANLDPKFDIKFLDYEFFNGGVLKAEYDYKVEPAFTKGLYFRTDLWQMNLTARPSDAYEFSEDLNSTFSLGPSHGIEAKFIRSFSDPCKAMTARPYAPNRAPLKVETALGSKFKKGDYFLFKASLGFALSGELLGLMGTSWGLSLGGSYYVQGHYQIHIVRQDDTHVRLKVIAQRGKGINGTFGLGYLGDFDVFAVNTINKKILKTLEPNPIKVTAGKAHSNVMIIDYVLDLSDAEVAEAYESLLSKVKKFKTAKIVAPFKSDKDVQEKVLLDIAPLEDIYRADYRSGNINRIKRNLRASSGQDSKSLEFKIGNKILGYNWKGTVSTSKMRVRQQDDNLEYFLLRNWDREIKGRVFYRWLRTQKDKGVSALFTTDSEFNIESMINMIHYENRKRTHFKNKQLKEIKLLLKKALPSEIESKIPWSEWNQGANDKFTNFGMRLQMVLSPQFIVDMPQLSRTEIVTLYSDYLLSKGLRGEDFFTEHNQDNGPIFGAMTAEQQLYRSIRDAAKILELAMNKSKTMLERLNAITELKDNTVFSETGLGFILAIRPDLMKSFFHVNLNLSANESVIDFEYGDANISALYKKLLLIKAALENDGLDLLIEAESLSIPENEEDKTALISFLVPDAVVA